MFTAGLTDPDQVAADLFPKQAKSNPSIFYADGKPRTIRQVYRALVAKHEAPAAADPAFLAQQLAATPESKWPQAQAIPSRFSPDNVSFASMFSTEGEIAPRTLLSPVEEPQGGAFFTQLYGP